MDGLSHSLQNVGRTYSLIIQEYSKKSFLNSASDESFKDSNENIFVGDLKTLIESDRVITCNQDSLESAIEQIKKNISQREDELKDHEKSLRYRGFTALVAKRILRSESHYLADWQNRLWLSTALTENCLIKLNEIGESHSSAPEDDDSVLLLLNRCTVLSRIPYLQKEFLEKLRELNGKVQKKSGQFYNSNLYFRLGTLNFSAHNYTEAREQLLLAVAKLEAREASLSNEETEMLFYSHLEIVMAYEFCGKYREALAYLIDAEAGISEIDICNEYLKIFRDSLGNKVIETLSFRSEDTDKKTGIIELLTPILRRDPPIFPGRMASFAVAHREEFLDRVAEYNNEVDSLIDNIPFDTDLIKNVEKKTKVKSSAHKKEEQNQAFHDYLHLVAHCLNELGVELINDFDPNAGNLAASIEELAHRTIILARALMLFVSEAHEFYSECHMYKSCFATVFAEVGDFDIAEQELIKILSDQKYPELDVVSKAEIDFFTYRVRRMKKISSGELDYLGDDKDTQYNHYLNLCYRLFDYDAIAHMSLISFEYYLSNILHEEGLENIGKYFSQGTEQQAEFGLRYFTFLHDTEGDSHNNWLNSERKKVEYIVEFLRSFFRLRGGSYSRDINIFDLASKCIHYCDFARARDDAQVRFISFASVKEVIEGLTAILPVDRYHVDKDYVELAIDSCTYFAIKSENGKQEFLNSLYKTNNMFFIHSKIGLFENELEYQESSRIRAFGDELDALREFFLLCAFMQVRADFTDPKSIFVLTPINNEGLCRYEVANFNTLLDSVIEEQNQAFDTETNPLNEQYKITVAGHKALSTDWLRRLMANKRYIKWAVSFLVDTDDPRGTIRYSLDVPGKKTLNAVMFRKSNCLSMLNNEFKPPWHSGRCNATGYCHICSVKYCDALHEKLLLSFAELPSAQIATMNGKLLIWKQTQEAYVCWRLVLTCPNNKIEEDENKKLLCNSGNDSIFERVYDRNIVAWPAACKPDDGKFLFICHSGLDDELVKNELINYFVHHAIRFWYDINKIVDEDSWLVRVSQIIMHKNCVGSVILVTNREFFKYNAIRSEFEILRRKKQESEGSFKVMPVFYNLGNNKDIEEQIKSSFNFGDPNQNAAQTTCQSLIIPNPEHVSIYLNDSEGKSLKEYHEREALIEKRQGSLLEACKKLGVLTN